MPLAMPRTSSIQSDNDLVVQIIAGNTPAFEILMRRYNPPLFRVARSILKQNADAEDALQEAHLHAFLHLATFRARHLMKEALSQEIETAYGDVFAFDGERCDRIVASVMARLP